MKRAPPELDKIVDAVLAFHPKPKTDHAKKRNKKKARSFFSATKVNNKQTGNTTS